MKTNTADAPMVAVEDWTANRNRIGELVVMDLHRRRTSFANSNASTATSLDEMSECGDEQDSIVEHENVQAALYVKSTSDTPSGLDCPPGLALAGLNSPPGLALPLGLDAPPGLAPPPEMLPHARVIKQPPGTWHVASHSRSSIKGIAAADWPLESIHADPACPPGVWHIQIADVAATEHASHQHSETQRNADNERWPQEVAGANSLLPGELSCEYDKGLGLWRVDWSVDLKKMRGASGSMISPGFEIDLGVGAGTLKFKVLLGCAASHEKRGGMMFKKARACTVALQCKSDSSELANGACITYNAWMTGKSRRGPVPNNFLDHASSSTKWNFSDTMAQTFASEFVISFEIWS